MRFVEEIRIASADSITDYGIIMRDLGFDVEFINNMDHRFRIWVEHETYDEVVFRRVQEIVKERGWTVSVNHGVVPDYEEPDFERPHLLSIDAPEIANSGTKTIRNSCGDCGKHSLQIDYSHRIHHLQSNKAIGTVGIVGLAVSAGAVEQLQRRQITGIRFIPMDKRGEWFHLLTEQKLDNPVIRKGDFIDYRGICDSCGEHQFEMMIGPYRFRESDWSGNDIVSSDYVFPQIFCKPDVLKALQEIEPEISFDRVAFLE